MELPLFFKLRKRDNKGLQLKGLTTHFKCTQLVKYHIMKIILCGREDAVHPWSHRAETERKETVEWCESAAAA